MAAEYKKGKTPVGGIDYEIKLQTLFALGGFQHYHATNWNLSNENEAAGKFDDLVFQLDDVGDVLLQLKHKGNDKLQENQFLSSNPNKDDFSLAKYILSFKTLRGFNIKYLILCTNCDLKMSLFKEKPLGECSVIPEIFENCKVYTINGGDYLNKIEEKILEYQDNLKPNINWKKLKVEKQDINEFVSKFLCIQAKDGFIVKAIRNKLVDIGNQIKCPVSSYKYVLDQIQEWYNSKPNKSTYMNNSFMKSILYGEKIKHYMENILDETTLFKDYHCFDLFNLFYIKPGKKYELSLKKILQGLWMSYKEEGKPKDMFYNEVLLLNTSYDMNICEELVDCFNVSKFKFLVMVILRDSNTLSLALNDFEKILKQRKLDKKIIVLSDQIYFNDKTVFKSITDEILFTGFLPETQNQFLEKQLLFQGAPFYLKQINTGNVNLDDLIDEYTIEKLIKSERFRIGLDIKELGDIKNYYICRKLQKINETFTENDILRKCKEPVLIISDQPGTGKSTLIRKLANDWKQQFPDHWVLSLDLGITIKYIKENTENSNLSDLLILHEKLENIFEKKLMKMLKKILILDGVDEISFNDRKYLLRFISEISVSDEIIRSVITTRSYSFILEELQVFENVDVTSLEEFSNNDQVEFFRKYFKQTRNIDVENAGEFIENCPTVFKHFLNIPLYIEMIADIFSDQIIIKIDKHNSTLSISNTYELFKLFINKKKELFIKNKCSCEDNSILYNILSDTFDRYIEDVEILAIIKEILSLIDLLNIDSNKQIRRSVLHLGVLEVVGKDIRFIHKTFEEYFVAQNIWKKINEAKVSENLLRQVYRQVFLNFEKQNICHFIDCILETKSDTDVKHLSKRFSKIVNEINYNEVKGINSLASQGSVNILKLLFDDCPRFSFLLNRKGRYGETAILLSAHHLPTVEYLIENGADVYSKDNNGFTALHYATTRFSNFEQFEFQLSSLSKTLLYKEMLYHINSVHHNLYEYNERQSNIKQRFTGCQRSLVLQRQANDFKDIVKYFKNNDMYLNTRTKIGSTILHYIAYCGLIKEFLCLIDAGAFVEIDDYYGNNIMHYAVLGGCLEIVEYLFNLGIDLNRPNSNKVAPIHFVPISNSLDVLKFLTSNGVDIETKDSYDRTTLFYANSGTSLDLVKFIVNLGVKIDRRSNELNYTALHMASYTNAIDIVDFFITNCKLKPTQDKYGQWPAHYAAEGNAVKVLKYFQNSVPPLEKTVDYVGASVLHLAAVGDSINAVIFFVEKLEMNATIRDFSNKTPLHYAAGSGSFKVFKYLVERGVNTNVTDLKGSTVLHYITLNKSMEMLKYVIEKSDTLNVTDASGKHAIHWAAENGFLDGVKHFIEIGVQLDLTDTAGNTILHYSALGNSVETTMYIYENYPDLYRANKNGKCPIHYSVEVDSVKTLSYFIKIGFDVNIVLHKNITLLHLAAETNSVKVVNYLINKCSFDLKKDTNGKLPSHYAAEGDALDVIKIFLRMGISKDLVDNDGCTILHYAASRNSMRILSYCINILRMDIKTPDFTGRLPLHHAAAANNLKAIRYLLSAGNLMDVSIPDYRNLTVLHWSASGNAIDSFRYFIRNCHSMDINAEDVLGRQPVHVAIQYDALEVVKFVFNHNFINQDIVDQHGNTLLHWATKYDSIRVIKYFIEECGMSLYRLNKLKITPLQTAVKYKSLKAMEYLELSPDKLCSIF